MHTVCKGVIPLSSHACLIEGAGLKSTRANGMLMPRVHSVSSSRRHFSVFQRNMASHRSSVAKLHRLIVECLGRHGRHGRL